MPVWVAKLRGLDKTNIYGTKAARHKVSIHYYPANHYLEKGRFHFVAIGLVEGPEKNVSAFFEELGQDNKPCKDTRYVVKLEREGNFFVCVTAQSKTAEAQAYVRFFYNPKFIHIRPAVIRPDGHEEWNVASLEREDLEKLLKVGREKYRAELLSVRKTKIGNVGILSVLPNLTERQKTAFRLAAENGYYEYPRKIELSKLSRLMHISLSTYQAHLRKAEKGLLLPIFGRYFQARNISL